MTLPESAQIGLGAPENIALDRPVEVAEIAIELVSVMRVNLWSGVPPFPIDAAILPQAPVIPQVILVE